MQCTIGNIGVNYQVVTLLADTYYTLFGVNFLRRIMHFFKVKLTIIGYIKRLKI